jgi:NAD(P)-dependent dehydrogenase (short-subunit alcohol dehydrogenase family)
MRLNNKIAIITGGGSGIGRASAELFAREGASVVVADYHGAAGTAAVEAIRAAGGNAVFSATDVSDPAQIERMVQTALDHYAGIDLLFNNAGVLLFGSILDTQPQAWNRLMAINLNGVYVCSRAVIPHMIARGGGAIVNVSSSTGAHDAHAGIAAYVASKGAVTLLTKAMAIDHAADNIRVNAVAPGPTDTPMLRDNLSADELAAFAKTFPMQRLGQPQELAQAVLYLASDDASFITGAILAVDGGQTAQI